MSDRTASWPRWVRRLSALAAVVGAVVLGRARALAANEKKYGDVLERPKPPQGNPSGR